MGHRTGVVGIEGHFFGDAGLPMHYKVPVMHGRLCAHMFVPCAVFCGGPNVDNEDLHVCKIEAMYENPMDEILPFLYVGCQTAASDQELLSCKNISYILNVSDKDYFTTYPEHFRVQYSPLDDFGGSCLEEVFDKCFDFINDARDRNAKVLVHCQVGVNRSPRFPPLSVPINYFYQFVSNFSCFRRALRLDFSWHKINPSERKFVHASSLANFNPCDGLR